MIKAEDVYAATEGGKSVILYFYPQSSVGFSGRRNFSIRGGDDRRPSCTVFNKSGMWWLQDKGGADTKAYNAIELARKEMNLSYPQAIEWIAGKFAPQLLDDGRKGFQSDRPRPKMSEAAPQGEITVEIRKGGKFTDAELKRLGYRITQELCDSFCLKPVASYITKANAKGKSYRIESTDTYPIYYYDYGSYGKIYQPLGELRFLWVGTKPEELISGDREFLNMYSTARTSQSERPFLIPADPDDESSVEQDGQWKELIICSGPSDSLNVRRAGWHVCWLNSETADLKRYEFENLKKIAKKIYILYDIDDTGRRTALRIAQSYLDISVIILPEDLSETRTDRGKPCKDAKDFFVYYRRPELGNIDDLFAGLVRLAGGLKFWSDKVDKKGNFLGYDINNTQLYAFLSAAGFGTIDDGAGGYTYCRIKDNRVELIDASQITVRCIRFLQEFITSHTEYYRQGLANAIFRSPQMQESSLRNLARVHPDFDAYTADADYFFFNNGIVRVTKDGIEKVSPSQCGFMAYEKAVIQHEFRPEEPFFEISHSDEYAAKLAAVRACVPRSPEFYSAKNAADAVPQEKRYTVNINRRGFDFMEFVWNTGRTFWRKEEAGWTLNEEERREHDINFISKVAMLGYLLSKYKDSAKAYGVYAMETEQGDEGEHRGGTGKSLLMRSVELLRNQEYIDGQGVKSDAMDFILQGVRPGITDNIYVDDLNNKIDLHRFMNWITGKMEVNPKYKAKITLDFKDSPKVSFSSNHAIRNFDNSLQRRTWFVAFSSYYHADDEQEGLVFRSPETEFGRTLIQDYGEEDMNHLYNFFFNCIMVWKKFKVRIQPSMRKIKQRNLMKSMTQEFLWWADDWFDSGKLDTLIDRQEAFDAYKSTLSKTAAEVMRPQTFKNRLQMFCSYHDYVFNPKCLLRTESERQRNDIRKKMKYEDKFFFYIDTTHNPDLPVAEIFGGFDGQQGDGDTGGVIFPGADDDKPPF